MFENQITITGNACNDPELRIAKSGEEFAAFRVASSTRRRNPETNQWEDGETSFFRVTAWRSLGTNVARSVRKGQPVVVHGRLRVSRFVREDNVVVTSADISAEAVGHNLALGQTTFARPGAGLRLAPDPSREALYDGSEDAYGARGGHPVTELATPYEGDYDLIDQVTGEVTTMGGSTEGAATDIGADELENPLASAI